MPVTNKCVKCEGGFVIGPEEQDVSGTRRPSCYLPLSLRAEPEREGCWSYCRRRELTVAGLLQHEENRSSREPKKPSEGSSFLIELTGRDQRSISIWLEGITHVCPPSK